MKTLVENSFWFRLLVLVLYLTIDVADARWFIPYEAGKCKGALTAQQEEQCFHWYYINIKRKSNG